MFKLAVNPTYTATVKVAIPSDGGKTIQREFQAEFKRLTQSELDEINDRLLGFKSKEGEEDYEEVERLTDDELVRMVMVGWAGVQDESGADLEFNEANLSALLDVFPVRPSIVKTFFATIGGAKVKN